MGGNHHQQNEALKRVRGRAAVVHCERGNGPVISRSDPEQLGNGGGKLINALPAFPTSV